MPVPALLFYLHSKYKHETVRDSYFADMLRFAAWTNVKDGEKLPRYWDSIQPDDNSRKASNARTAKGKDYDENDVIDMLVGRGKLV